MFGEEEVVESYEDESLTPAEAILLLEFSSDFRGKSILDLGVGTGRTTRYLLPFSTRYVGLDFSSQMLASCKRKFPQAELILTDIRDLSILGSEKFDFVFAPYNFLDGLVHSDRMRVLESIRDRLNDDGIFAFSSHNLACQTRLHRPVLGRSRNPVTQIAMIATFFVGMKNYSRLKPLEERHQGYAMLCDVSHNWRGLVYFVDRIEQEAQLEAAGFRLLKVYDSLGDELVSGDSGKSSIDLYYVCKGRSKV